MSSSSSNDHIGYLSPGIKVFQAKPEDTEAVLQLLVRTAEWLKSMGSTQWSGLLQGQDSHNTPEAIKRGEVYIFKKKSVLVGMVMLMQKASAWDIELWGDEGHESSVYLHRLAINRDEAGKDLGRQIVNWAGSGIHFAGKDRVRLDCLAYHEKLNAFYTSCGYEWKGIASNPLGDFSKYEKSVTR
ncbi:putative N-acetyltransferase YesJ [Paenibacillus baekrokdamisoli]|uniref:Putative N-acetyltransferase YesJ n=1 Tax=Paenibacillus baekrokdamisoli TaxID=1712516 RepID=A0A3G9IQH9_9BACL|nr:GNAT family N-acetyltransferase [Paenibacillus baekrokdamisoli]MBB3070015.1 GNAT superfamily N-acetyltransferase [Paenibacillus baekrokdamisoli]BBH20636.1 putative N-acetyltransferase YesJ [Paenibacillus baekrokdamisoli]